MACLFCHSAQMKPAFWETGWDEKTNPYYVSVTTKNDNFGFRTSLSPPNIVARWRADGGMCFQRKFIPWNQIQIIEWNPPLERQFLDEVEE